MIKLSVAEEPVHPATDGLLDPQETDAQWCPAHQTPTVCQGDPPTYSTVLNMHQVPPNSWSESLFRIRIQWWTWMWNSIVAHPDPHPTECFWTSRIRIRILLSSSKHSTKNLDFYCWLFYDYLSLKNNVNLPPVFRILMFLSPSDLHPDH